MNLYAILSTVPKGLAIEGVEVRFEYVPECYAASPAALEVKVNYKAPAPAGSVARHRDVILGTLIAELENEPYEEPGTLTDDEAGVLLAKFTFIP